MSGEVEGAETEDENATPPTLTEAVAALTPEERGEDPETADTDPAPPPKSGEKPAPAKFQATARRGAREARKLERAAKDLEAKAKAAELSAQERAELQEKRELEQLRKDDPAAYAERTGLDIDRMTTSWLEKAKPDAKVSALEKRLDAEKAEREKGSKAAKTAESKAKIADAEKTFVAALAEKADDYPAIADMDARELFGRGPTDESAPAYQVAREIAAHAQTIGYPKGWVPSDEQIMRELNAREEAKIAKRAERLGYARGSAASPAAKAKAAPSGKTIQGAATRQRAAAPPPETDFNRKMTSQELQAAIAAELEKETRKQAAGGR